MVFSGRIARPIAASFSSTTNPLLKVGDVLRKPRTFNHLDLVNYAELTSDYNPIHFDSGFAKEEGFEDRVVHGMLVATLFPRVIASHFPGAVYVSQSLQFKLPVYIGNEAVAEVKALNIRENKKRYLAKFSTKCFRDGDLVIDGEALAILPTLEIREEPFGD
ncbi:hypothetical protein H6P81_001793 [Aristolochia fimbriata]|uniref:MaoC-like domain-containing protein n=1 Tax=Aristolochia fimbriata TaxID=158543 RepID=A0AAV7FAN4_ARIFI|nr:hypothetical protein H6P81_001793 [Aristolochia fimbriata]